MPRQISEIRVEGNDAFITLTKGYVAVIDAADAHLVAERAWQAKESLARDGHVMTVYATSGMETLRLHRAIIQAKPEETVDHIDGNGLNNRRSNLRICTKSENAQNRRTRRNTVSGVKGVVWHKRIKKWQASIMVGGKGVHLGYFQTVEAAAAAYAKASAERHKQFGRLA
jgi:hypothetical protein